MATTDTKTAALTVEQLRALDELDGPQRHRLDDLLTEHYGREVRVIRFLDRWMATVKPTVEQLAVMARLRTASKGLDIVKSDDPRRGEMIARTAGSLQQTLASFFADQDDWDAIEVATLMGALTYEEDMPRLWPLVFEVWKDEAQEDNRGARRARARRA